MSKRLQATGIVLALFSVCCPVFSSGALAWGTEARQTPMVRAVERAKASVVNIHTEKLGRSGKINGMGTGILVDEHGYIITNQHVISEVDTLRVTTCDGATYQARVINFDRKHDLALIKIDSNQLFPVIPLGTSSDLMLGETVIAVGNAYGYEHTVTAGIISALHRNVDVDEKKGIGYKNLIQTDASINPGNSGGPLLNLDGDVIGINVAIRQGAQRIGFAIPIDDARQLIAHRLMNTRELDRMWHGLVGTDRKSSKTMQLVVQKTEDNSPAQQAGLKAGDIVLEVNKHSIRDLADFERYLLGATPGQKMSVVVNRNGTQTPISLEMVKLNGGSSVPVHTVTHDGRPDYAWQIMGVTLVKEPEQNVQKLGMAYSGGMRVVSVRPGSPAQQQRLQAGDVLVGLHVYESAKPEDVNYVLTREELQTEWNPLKVTFIRDGKPYYALLQLD
ncbi:MAG: trypsin-like peptidase domain-containing protein [Planctomycetales bacterium]